MTEDLPRLEVFLGHELVLESRALLDILVSARPWVESLLNPIEVRALDLGIEGDMLGDSRIAIIEDALGAGCAKGTTVARRTIRARASAGPSPRRAIPGRHSVPRITSLVGSFVQARPDAIGHLGGLEPVRGVPILQLVRH